MSAKVIEPEVVDDKAHTQMEDVAISLALSIDSTVEKLLKPGDEEHVPTGEDIDRSIDLIQSGIQMMAIHYKGLEVKNKGKYLNQQKLQIGNEYGDPKH